MDKIVAFMWSLTVLCWTVARFIIPVVVFWKFIVMLVLWNTPGAHAGLTFAAYFTGYTALYYFVAFYRPKSMRDR